MQTSAKKKDHNIINEENDEIIKKNVYSKMSRKEGVYSLITLYHQKRKYDI